MPTEQQRQGYLQEMRKGRKRFVTGCYIQLLALAGSLLGALVWIARAEFLPLQFLIGVGVFAIVVSMTGCCLLLTGLNRFMKGSIRVTVASMELEDVLS